MSSERRRTCLGVQAAVSATRRERGRVKRFMIVALARASVRFYAELNDHLAPHQRHQTLEQEFFTPASVKNVIESFGIPHTEVELVVVNGESSDFSRLVRDGDRVAVYPVFESLDITPELHVRPQPLREPKFALDVHLGRLAAYLRMLGFDTDYRNCASDAELVRIAAEQERILLTRDRGLLKHAAVTRGYWLRQTDSRRQATEVVSRFDLARLRPFTRCMACNERLRPLYKEEVQKRVLPPIAARHEKFLECSPREPSSDPQAGVSFSERAEPVRDTSGTMSSTASPQSIR